MKTFLSFAFFFIIVSINALGQNRHALLIGINKYEAKTSTPVAFVNSRQGWQDLDGCVNDVKAIKQIITTKYGFTNDDVKTLFDQEATNQSIKNEIIKLKEKAKSGDIIFFYYSGHGSQVKNSLSYDRSGMDQTIVPSDLYDIRNKELSKLFNDIMDKIGPDGKLTVIFDSCHSGGVARGKVSSNEPKSRDLPGVDFDYKDPSEYPKIEDRGALVFSASQRDQKAKETSDSEGNAFGAFSHAFTRALGIASISESAERLFMRTNILLQSSNRQQDPVIGGSAARKKQGIFGNDIEGLKGKTIIPLASIRGQKDVILQGGIESGLYPGTLLRKIQTTDTLIIKVVKINGIASCSGEVVHGSYRKLAVGDLFEISNFATPEKPNLRVRIPASAFSIQELGGQTKDFTDLVKSRYLVSVIDPVVEIPEIVIQYDQGLWKYNRVGNTKWEVLPNLTSEVIKKKVAKGKKVLLQLPAAKELLQQLKFGAGTQNSAIEITDNAALADYTLIGISGDTIQYSWVKIDAIGTNGKGTTPPRTNFFSQFSSVADSLTEYAVRLGRINAWMNLPSPPQDEYTFPYVLGLKNRDTKKIYSLTDNVYDRDRMTLIMKADSAALQNWDRKKRFCYVFIIDAKGKTTLLYPSRNLGSEFFPLQTGSYPTEEPLKVNFEISPPFGYDTYFLLTTETPILDTSIFDADGILTRGSSSGGNPLTQLLRNVGSRSRGAEPDTPANWSIQKLMLNSLPKPL